ncbi:MAG: hypothetical protein D6769_03070 [Methanobacteriota archaeon]|nr:MAG: hypothetical protein D6769_03070 [Euryarchaeota archaeon]
MKLLSVAIALLLVLAFAGCLSTQQKAASEKVTATQQPTPEEAAVLSELDNATQDLQELENIDAELNVSDVDFNISFN